MTWRACQRPVPTSAVLTLSRIPRGFVDDGCSNSPDGWFQFNFRWACRIHDWRYCTRCHPATEMTQEHRHAADRELAENIRSALPWRWGWVRYVYKAGVWYAGGVNAWNSCGPEAGALCRHGITMRPEWAAPDGA